MASRLVEIFKDKEMIKKIQKKLPYLFALAELEASRAGRVGMEAGSLREKVLIALLIHKFGEENVDVEVPITQPEVDVNLFGFPISIKTGRRGGVKAVWTVNAQSAREFIYKYAPRTEILLARIKWGGKESLYLIPLETQKKVFEGLGREKYFKLPKPGTNPRGVEFSGEALKRMCKDPKTKKIEIFWEHPKAKVSPYEVYRRWLDYWKEE